MAMPIYAIANAPLFLLGFENLLVKEKFEYRGGYFPQDALQEINEPTPFLLLVHLAGKLKDNLEYLKKLLRKLHQARIILVHSEESQQVVKAYFQTGVKAYVLPSISVARLREALDHLARGQAYVDPCLSQRWSSVNMGLSSSPIKLTRREKEVLHLIVDEYTTKEIAEKLYISACTAETHRLNIIHKLGVRNTAGVVREAVLMGW